MKKKMKPEAFGKFLRETFSPNETLCNIQFSDGFNTNDLIPNNILEDRSLNLAEWFNEERSEEYLSIQRGERKVIKVTPIVEH